MSHLLYARHWAMSFVWFFLLLSHLTLATTPKKIRLPHKSVLKLTLRLSKVNFVTQQQNLFRVTESSTWNVWRYFVPKSMYESLQLLGSYKLLTCDFTNPMLMGNTINCGVKKPEKPTISYSTVILSKRRRRSDIKNTIHCPLIFPIFQAVTQNKSI